MKKPSIAEVLSRPPDEIKDLTNEQLLAELKVLVAIDRKLSELGIDPDDPPPELKKLNSDGGTA